jgi:two-component system cell cycle sensor histidine kinase/response regulator CckA
MTSVPGKMRESSDTGGGTDTTQADAPEPDPESQERQASQGEVSARRRTGPWNWDDIPTISDVAPRPFTGDMLSARGLRILQLVASGTPLKSVLEALLRTAEDQVDGMVGSVLLVEDGVLRHCAAPNLSPAYTSAIDGLPIGPARGSCGSAAYLRETVVVEDIATDPSWVDFRALALAQGLRACWSVPILGTDDKLLGTFAFYYREPQGPTPELLELIHHGGHLAAIAIERWRHDIERKRMEVALSQLQNLEAISTLTGWLAHDFNNILNVISAYAESLRMSLGNDPRRTDAEEILGASARAAVLTQQLMAFGRKQTLQPKVLDPNEVIAAVAVALARVLPQSIALMTVLARDVWPVFVDPTQLEQVVRNLVVNAREAMPDGGRLVIESRNTELPEPQFGGDAEISVGSYVAITVSDTGIGMDAATRSRIFEPFFTTKEAGQGAGLGLATVYGIVKQSGGHIQVDSELGRGTTFSLHFARSLEPMPAPSLETPVDSITDPIPAAPIDSLSAFPPSKARLSLGSVLLVEDAPALRRICARTLRGLPCEVTTCANGVEALAIVEEHGLSPDLLITDIVMPGMSGSLLAERLCERLPRLKVLYISGYADNAIPQLGLLPRGTAFLQKPFSVPDFIAKVERVFQTDEPNA